MNENFNLSWYALNEHHNLNVDTSDFSFNGFIDNWSYSVNHTSVNKEFVSDNIDREELTLRLSKNFSKFKTSYSRRYDLRNNNEELLSEVLGIEYNDTGYMFGNCLTILFEYKSSSVNSNRDLLADDSINMTFSFRNLGDLIYKP